MGKKSCNNGENWNEVDHRYEKKKTLKIIRNWKTDQKSRKNVGKCVKIYA